MIKFTFINNKNRISFIIQSKKYLFIRDINDYWSIRKTFESMINKESDSEYSLENETSTKFFVDEEEISKNDELIIIDSHFSINDDSKMGSKSLLLRYTSSLINNNIIRDEFLQADAMLSMLSDIVSNDLIEYEGVSINSKVFFLKEEMKCGDKDLSYEENIIYQIDLVKEIVNSSKRFIILIDIMRLTRKIYEKTNELDNCYVIVLSQFNNISNLDNNIFIEGIDFEDDELLYERMMSMSNLYYYEEFKNNLKIECLNKIK